MLLCGFPACAFRAADRGCEVSTRPSLRPLGQGGWNDQAKLGRNAPRVREGVSTIQDASWKSGATASYSVIASAAKQSSLPPRRDSGLLRSARKDALRECAPHATLASPVRSAEAFAARRGHARGGMMKAPTHLGCASWSRRSCGAGIYWKPEVVDGPPARGYRSKRPVSSRPRMCRLCNTRRGFNHHLCPFASTPLFSHT
jgi:hypothetical protein